MQPVRKHWEALPSSHTPREEGVNITAVNKLRTVFLSVPMVLLWKARCQLLSSLGAPCSALKQHLGILSPR